MADVLVVIEELLITEKTSDLALLQSHIEAYRSVTGTTHPASSVALPASKLSMLEACVKEQMNDVANFLLDKDFAMVDECVGFTCTALCKTCYQCAANVGLVKILLFYGSDPNATISNDGTGVSCLMACVMTNNRDSVEILLGYGADITYTWKGQNALSMAVDFRHTEIIDLIEETELSQAHSNMRQHEKNRKDFLLKKAPRQLQEDIEVVPIDFQKTLTEQSIMTRQFIHEIQKIDWIYKPADITIGPCLGRGGFGTVHKAKLLRTGDHVACKILTCRDHHLLNVYKSELTLLSKFRHESIVLFLGAVVDLPQLCILTELLSCNLHDRLTRDLSVDISWDQRLKWLRGIAKAMNYLHSCDPAVVHRDLKSLNVLLDEYEKVKLCDFGLSVTRGGKAGEDGGSPAWMAPEVFRGEGCSMYSDVYSYGVVMWETLARCLPWAGVPIATLIQTVGHNNSHVPLEDIDTSSAPHGFIEILLSCRLEGPKRPSFRQIVSEIGHLQEIGVFGDLD